jgi:hypothetical protein
LATSQRHDRTKAPRRSRRFRLYPPIDGEAVENGVKTCCASIEACEGQGVMAEAESHTLAYLRRREEKLDRLHTEVGERFDRVEGRLGAIEDELLVLNGIALRLEGREHDPKR